MEDPVVVWFLSQKQLLFFHQALCDFPEMLGLHSPFGFYVGFLCQKLSVKLVVSEINEVHHSAQECLSQVWLVAASKEYVHDEADIFFFIDFH